MKIVKSGKYVVRDYTPKGFDELASKLSVQCGGQKHASWPDNSVADLRSAHNASEKEKP